MTNLSLLEVPDFLLHNSNCRLNRSLLWQRSPIIQGLLCNSRRHLQACNTLLMGLTTDFSFENSVLGMRRPPVILLAASEVAARGLSGGTLLQLKILEHSRLTHLRLNHQAQTIHIFHPKCHTVTLSHSHINWQVMIGSQQKRGECLATLSWTKYYGKNI